ncbi:MAG: hypothetical protein HYU54_03610, partial [Actinobacteria bacterium]|nr:hypothetical protein [Actinomycetota bacterium]
PDQFGHIGQMPQILRQAGIDKAVVWRGVPKAVDKTTFWWESPDGSRVMTEYLAFGYFLGDELHRAETPEQTVEQLRRAVERLRPYAARDRLLIMVGGDHSEPHEPLPERLAEANERAPDLDARVGSLDDHFQGRVTADLPTWRGELRSSARAHLLPNVYSARVHQKRERARIEALLERYAEPLAALVPGFEWPVGELDRAWLLLLWNGAHDSACGCSHDRVARDVDVRNKEAGDLSEDIIDRALAALGAQVAEAGVLRFNPSPFKREGVPGLGWRVDRGAVEGSEVPVEVAARDGWIVADGLELTLMDEPDVGDLYNFCYAEEGQRPVPPARLSIRGQLVTAGFDDVEVRFRVFRRAAEPFIRVEGEIDNRRPDHRLRLHVRLPEEATGAVAGSPFELVERGPVSEGSDLEAPSHTWPARGVVAAGGLAMFSEGVVEYEIAGGRDLAVTLLRCVGTISREFLATRPFVAGPSVPTPDAQMLGTTAFSLGFHRGARREDLVASWERFALPIRSTPAAGSGSTPAAGSGSLPAAGSLLEIEGTALLSSIRRHGDVIEVRLWNASTEHAAEARVGDQPLTLGPAQIVTLAIDRPDRD